MSEVSKDGDILKKVPIFPLFKSYVAYGFFHSNYVNSSILSVSLGVLLLRISLLVHLFYLITQLRKASLLIITRLMSSEVQTIKH